MSVFFHLRGSTGVSWTSTRVRDLNDNPPLWLRILTWSQDFGFMASVMVANGNVAAAKKYFFKNAALNVRTLVRFCPQEKPERETEARFCHRSIPLKFFSLKLSAISQHDICILPSDCSLATVSVSYHTKNVNLRPVFLIR